MFFFSFWNFPMPTQPALIRGPYRPPGSQGTAAHQPHAAADAAVNRYRSEVTFSATVHSLGHCGAPGSHSNATTAERPNSPLRNRKATPPGWRSTACVLKVPRTIASPTPAYLAT
jgi:hypothetical protein